MPSSLVQIIQAQEKRKEVQKEGGREKRERERRREKERKKVNFPASAWKLMQFVFFLQNVSTSLNFRECAVSANLTCHLKCTCNTTRVILKEVIDQQVETSGKAKTYL